MTKELFLKEMRLSFQGRLSHDKIEKQLSWYEDYILMRIRKGDSEAEVLDELGDPRLLVNSVLASAESEDRVDFDDEWKETPWSLSLLHRVILALKQFLRRK